MLHSANYSNTTTRGVRPTSTSVVRGHQRAEALSLITRQSHPFQGMGGRLFASLSEASPVLSYIVGGGIFWTISSALDALTPDQSPTNREDDTTGRSNSYSYEAFPLITRYHSSSLLFSSLSP